jgi:hypothetical protein
MSVSAGNGAATGASSSRREAVILIGITRACRRIPALQGGNGIRGVFLYPCRMNHKITAVAGVLALAVPAVAGAAGKPKRVTPPKPQNVQVAASLDGSRTVRFTCDYGGQTFGGQVAEGMTLFRNGKRLQYAWIGPNFPSKGSKQGCGVVDQHPPGGPATYEVALVGYPQAWYPDNPPIVKSDPITVETVGPPPGACSVMLSFGVKSQVRRSLQKQGKARVSAIGTECVGKVTNVVYTWEQSGKGIELGSLPVTLGDYYERMPAVLKVDKAKFKSTKGGTLTATATVDDVTVTRSITFSS